MREECHGEEGEEGQDITEDLDLKTCWTAGEETEAVKGPTLAGVLVAAHHRRVEWDNARVMKITMIVMAVVTMADIQQGLTI